MADDLVPVSPEIRTLARPVSGVLLAARQEIQRNPALRRLFQQARDESWPIDRFAAALDNILHARIEGGYPEIREVCRYLADEYMQLGDGMFIILRATGKVAYKVTEEDIWQPPATVREDGHIVTPQPRLRPELEGYLIQWAFNEANDARLLRESRDNLATTAFLTEAGDPRLLPVTRVGRKTIIEEIREDLSTLIPDRVRGVPGSYLSFFEVTEEDPPYGSPLVPLLQSTAVATIRFGLQDPTTFNLNFDYKTALQSRIAVQWVSEMARVLSMAAVEHAQTRTIRFPDLEVEDLDLGVMWVFSPEDFQAIERSIPETISWLRGESLIVAGARTTLIRRSIVGMIVLNPSGYELRSREVNGRWDVVALCEYTLWVDWESLQSLVLTDLPVYSEVV